MHFNLGPKFSTFLSSCSTTFPTTSPTTLPTNPPTLPSTPPLSTTPSPTTPPVTGRTFADLLVEYRPIIGEFISWFWFAVLALAFARRFQELMTQFKSMRDQRLNTPKGVPSKKVPDSAESTGSNVEINNVLLQFVHVCYNSLDGLIVAAFAVFPSLAIDDVPFIKQIFTRFSIHPNIQRIICEALALIIFYAIIKFALKREIKKAQAQKAGPPKGLRAPPKKGTKPSNGRRKK